ncbi:hypothetical protein [Cohnella sp. CFH 77786]|uniref:hypothetical protein n=1 Tax=Cohnella sp. CFH 77786 TaxID=2662265 RepID=UPI002105047F|nr:hypothetical protein [Cohnella sp. CFH 77786]
MPLVSDSDSPDNDKPNRVPAALKIMKERPKKEVSGRVEDMKPYVVEHEELKLIGIPCISLNDMNGKYRHAKDALLVST